MCNKDSIKIHAQSENIAKQTHLYEPPMVKSFKLVSRPGILASSAEYNVNVKEYDNPFGTEDDW